MYMYSCFTMYMYMYMYMHICLVRSHTGTIMCTRIFASEYTCNIVLLNETDCCFFILNVKDLLQATKKFVRQHTLTLVLAVALLPQVALLAALRTVTASTARLLAIAARLRTLRPFTPVRECTRGYEK